ncbi:ERI1 exoribonuclease 3-like isoform X2 [Mercenaria mercenaria]|uniref:ERI1 exoribonuclease 3-like isoform X2 n=1 Tax=Mercenaria mercenaria TaxID=6596 RepID=UPI00234E60CC|nr:ERI1 exoribonuclease 3-like isoform X2 [Mercenaria mercenaria]
MKLFGLSKHCTFVFNSKQLECNFRFLPHVLRKSVIHKPVVNQSLNLSTSCTVSAGRKSRNTSSRSRLKMATANLKEQYFDYFLVLDFEATCKENEQIHPQEIIEFPVLKINSKTLETETTFHQYVQPRVHKELTPFCTKLTGIIQDMVDGQPHIEDVLKSFDKWMADNKLLDENVKSVFVTCGDWDLNKMLPKQAEHFKLEIPGYFDQWLNIKKMIARTLGIFW